VAVVAAFACAKYPLTAVAVVPTRALAWSSAALRRALEAHPKVALNLLEMLSERLCELQKRFRELATLRVEQRVARALLRLVRQAGRQTPEGVLVDLPLSREDLAKMTGTTLFTVSRVMSAWEARQIVASGRERVVIRSPHELVSIAEDVP
jgi:CRP-like cAMP-binding protein